MENKITISVSKSQAIEIIEALKYELVKCGNQLEPRGLNIFNTYYKVKKQVEQQIKQQID